MEEIDSDCSYGEDESSEYDSSDGNSDSEGFTDSQAEETDGGSDVDATTSEDEAEDEDDREEYSAANMRKRIKRLEEDEEEVDDDDSPVKRPQGKKSKSRRILSSDEEGGEVAGAGVSSGDDAGQTCTICLLKFESQELGLPSSCSHVFCADCIIEWTANVPTCPIDRKNIRSVKVLFRREVK